MVDDLPDWSDLRHTAAAIKQQTLLSLDSYLVQFEKAVTAAGGQVHWARDGGEANRIVTGLVEQTGATEVVKSKSMVTEEIGLNEALLEHGIEPIETDLAELIIQLAGEPPSHILAPAVHKNRAEIRQLFREKLSLPDLSDDPRELTEAARKHLRERFLRARVAVSGANFLVAETGAVCLVESEGNGRMCLTLPETLITVTTIEKVVPTFRDLEVFLQLLPRSSTSERMNPYTSIWTGVRKGDGPQAFHLVLLDNGRTGILQDPVARQTLRCIRCSACVNACPVYERVGGHAYGSVYSGPIGAILTPQLRGIENASTLPYASSLCGACYEVCPVEINIPQVLVHLRGKVVDRKRKVAGVASSPEGISMAALGWMFADRRRYERAQRLGRMAQRPLVKRKSISWLPGELSGWTAMRDAPPIAAQTFREWWRTRSAHSGQGLHPPVPQKARKE
jgi:L-lactate dehydrogenase complex protein LldF